MPAAARAGDMTEHKTPLNPALGSPNVRIGGQPAWRAEPADVHQCPQSTGNVPHVGGMVVGGSSKVRINGFPAARKDDTIVEVGASNKITGGFAAVKIG